MGLSRGARQSQKCRVNKIIGLLRSAADAVPFPISKEKQFVFFNRTADRAAKLIAREGPLRTAVRLVKKILRRERRDAVVFVRRTMKTVRTTLGHKVHDRRRRAA